MHMQVIGSIFGWLNDAFLKMTWLSDGMRFLLERVFGLSTATAWGGSLHFFLYDVVKIFILLSVLIYGISYIQSYFPPERTKKILGKMNGITGSIMGALLGTLTPFCSCSSIPLFIGFTEAGLPLGVTFSFLISSPLVDLAAFLVLVSVFGIKIALAYVLVGLVLAVVGGTVIGKLHMEKYVQDYIWAVKSRALDAPELARRDRLSFAWGQVKDIVKRVWLYILVGVGIGAIIHNWIPQQFIEAVLGKQNPFSVLIATGVGIPMYADIFGTIPVAEALFSKGVGVGTVLSFMMAVTALSLPSMILLSKVVKPKLLWLFIGIVTAGIIIIGYAFNTLSGILV